VVGLAADDAAQRHQRVVAAALGERLQRTGTSSAPGTCTWWMSLAATPSASSSERQAEASASVMSALKRACTMPMRRPFPFSGFDSAPLFAPCMVFSLS